MLDDQATLESLLAASPVGLAFFDRDLRFVRVNAAFAVITGQPVEAHIGRSIAEVSPDLSAAVMPLLQQVVETGSALCALELVRDGRSYVADYFPIRANGVTTGVGGVLIDITERRRIEAELRQTAQLREDVLAVVSHDLRSPLATIELTASMLGMQLENDPRVRRHLDMIHRSTMQMQHMIEDLLDSASIRAGRLSLQLHRECAERLMTEALEQHEMLATERGIRLTRVTDTNGAVVHCDRFRIIQVFGNLVGNSIKFGRPGDEIVISARHTGTEVEYSIRDRGPGISPDVLPSLFDPYRKPPSQAHAGSGLGLHICKGIVERHGGRIWAETTPGQGTTMSFTLPVTTTGA